MNPEATLTAYRLPERMWDIPIVPAERKRDWMRPQAYHCLPMVIANQCGWFLLCTYDFEVEWDGSASPDGLSIRYPEGDPENIYTVSNFGDGILTIRLPYLFRTPPGFNLVVRGPANWIRPNAQALDGIVETDWAPMTFTMNWKLHLPLHPVRFKKGEPFCMIFPQRRGDVEAMEPEIQSIQEAPELAEQHAQFSQKRKFTHAHAKLQKKLNSETPTWDLDYLKGNLTGEEKTQPEHQTRLEVKPFHDLDEGTSKP